MLRRGESIRWDGKYQFYYKDGSEALIEQHGKNPRMLTPRECARLQGFTDDFIIPVSNARAYKQFGNSVCIPVIEAVAKVMLEYLEKPYSESHLLQPSL